MADHRSRGGKKLMNQLHSRGVQVSNVLSVSIGVITREPAKEQKYLANRLIIISLSFSS